MTRNYAYKLLTSVLIASSMLTSQGRPQGQQINRLWADCTLEKAKQAFDRGAPPEVAVQESFRMCSEVEQYMRSYLLQTFGVGRSYEIEQMIQNLKQWSRDSLFNQLSSMPRPPAPADAKQLEAGRLLRKIQDPALVEEARVKIMSMDNERFDSLIDVLATCSVEFVGCAKQASRFSIIYPDLEEEMAILADASIIMQSQSATEEFRAEVGAFLDALKGAARERSSN